LKKFEVLISETAIKQLGRLEEQAQSRIKKHLFVLKEDPFRPRPLADIKKLRGFDKPILYRLRIGDFRVIYTIQGNQVKITEIILRKKGYAWRD
jgi:mRNA interferase RelE/StbE